MSNEAAIEIRDILAKTLTSHHEAVLSSISPSGRPHAAWMGVAGTHDFKHLITVTSATSEKVTNIRQNPHVEWMFTSPDRLRVIYFEGDADVLVDEQMKQHYLNIVPDETRGFFMRFYRHGGQWVVVRTRLDNVVYCMPGAYTKVRLSMDQVRA
jgi:general stress protein 26